VQADFASWRAEVERWHPLPDGFHSLCYLATEAGEALDSALRLIRPHDDRTNGHLRNLGRELAQVVDMAYAAALGYGIDLDAEIAAWQEAVRQRQPEGEHAAIA
jgi:NTP pyrophosphatase (non-canonical NTP hydrolase)